MLLKVRSTDPHSAVLVRFETNDKTNNPVLDPPRRPFGILTILPVVPDGVTPFDPGKKDYPYGQDTTLGAVHVTSTQTYPIDGASQPVALDLTQMKLTPEGDPFPCFRVLSVRAIGSVTVESVLLRKRSPIPGV
jgi:hypothetical protein